MINIRALILHMSIFDDKFYYSQEVCLCDLDELWDMSFVLHKHMFVSCNCFVNIMDKQYVREENDLIFKK